MCVYACACSVLSNSVTPWTLAPQAPLCTVCSRQEYWSGLPFLPLGNFSDPEIKPTFPVSPALDGRFFIAEPKEKPQHNLKFQLKMLFFSFGQSFKASEFLLICSSFVKVLYWASGQLKP